MKQYFIDVIPKGIQSMRVAKIGKFIEKPDPVEEAIDSLIKFSKNGGFVYEGQLNHILAAYRAKLAELGAK